MQDESAALSREWLVTNGLGGYASATLAGANTRRYHGLLVAALFPPLGRAVLLSKLEETLELRADDGSSPQSFPLSTNLYPGVTHPQGYRSLESWSAWPAPTWVWSPAPGVRFEKRVWMERGMNVTYIAYRLLEAPAGSAASLRLVPLIAGKDYHSEKQAGGIPFEVKWNSAELTREAPPVAALHITLSGIWNVTSETVGFSLRIMTEDGKGIHADYEADANWYYRFQHPRERERGLDYEEDLYAPGTFLAPLAVGETLVVTASAPDLFPPTPASSWKALAKRQADLLKKAEAKETNTRLLTLAADPFVAQVPGARSTVIAGYPWFSDWGRDTMISLPGLCIATGRAEVAREILLSFAAYVDQGMLPNRFPDRGATPEYNTVDATLWYFNALYHYVEATGDLALARDSLWNVLEGIVQQHRAGTRYHIRLDPADNLLFAGEAGVQLTWMDAKVGDWVVTPRIGKPVEINALWINALRIMAHFAARLGLHEDSAAYTALADLSAVSFKARFPRTDGQGLYDTLDVPPDRQPDSAIRPNQVFALSLPFAPLDPKSAEGDSILAIIEKELLTPFGLRTLSPRDPAYRPRYEGAPWHRDGAYHQGTVWPWPMGAFAEAHYRRHQDRAAAQAFLRPLLEHHLSDFGVGSIAEIFDGDPPQRPNGCIAQAWSVSETLRVWKWLLTA